MKDNKIYITWEEVFRMLDNIDTPENTVYGIPKGGMILTAFLDHAVVTHIPSEATIFLDDIIDSGKTMKLYVEKYPGTPFHALINKVGSKEDYLKYSNYWVVFPWEVDHPGEQEETIEENIIRQLQYIGEDPNREGLKETPARIVRSWDEIYSGYNKNPKDILTTFTDYNGYDQIVLLKNFEFFSMCEHHMLPFFGKAHVAYIPDKKVIGISKLARLVDIFARRLQIQERIGEQVTTTLMKELQPLGAACIIEASHLCMRMRGVNKQHSIMVTSSIKGAFMTDPTAKEELMQLIK